MQEFQVSYFSDESNKFNIHYHSIDGNLYFSLIDLVKITSKDVKNKASVIKHILNVLDDDEYQVQDNLMLVNESGLYRLLLKDQSIQGKKFMRWIVHEALPSIKSTRAYPSSTATEGCSVFIGTDGSDISLTDFSSYLSKLDLIYKYLAIKEGCSTDYITLDNEALESAQNIAKWVSESATSGELSEFGSISLPKEQQLKLIDLRRHNPIELVFSGVSIALVVALIISGGKFELGFTKLKIELPPLGEGIQKLISAFKSE